MKSMNTASYLMSPSATRRIRKSSVPVFVDLIDLEGLRRRERVFWIGNSMRVLVGNELRPVRVKKYA